MAKGKKKRKAEIQFDLVGREPEHETSREAVELAKIHPLLPRRIKDKYGMSGVVIFAVNSSGVSLLADGNMQSKSLMSLLRALREYEKIISGKLERLVS